DVTSIFYNTPARRKFLKSVRSEEMKISEWIRNISLVHPNISFKLIFDGKEKLSLPKTKSAFERFKRFSKGNSIEVSQAFDNIRIQGVIGHPSMSQGDW